MAELLDTLDSLDQLITTDPIVDDKTVGLTISPIPAYSEKCPVTPLDEPTFYVFVYGSLLSGSEDLFYNNGDYLQNDFEDVASADGAGGVLPVKKSFAVKIGDATTEKADFVMLSQVFKSYPYVIGAQDLAQAQACEDGEPPIGVSKTKINGEVWQVNQCVLDELDKLEGHPTHYCRREVSVVFTNTPPAGTPSTVVTSNFSNLSKLKIASPLCSPIPGRSPVGSVGTPTSTSGLTFSRQRRINRSPSASKLSNQGPPSPLPLSNTRKYSPTRTPAGSRSPPRSLHATPLSPNLSPPRRTDSRSPFFSSTSTSKLSSIRQDRAASSPPPPEVVRHKMTVKMYVLSNQSQIDAFGLSLKRSSSNSSGISSASGGAASNSDSIDDALTGVVGEELVEVTPLGDWRTYRTNTYDA